MTSRTDSLMNRSFIAACVSNLLVFFSVYMLMPVLPLYIVDEFHAGKSIAGIVLATYTITTLLVRPFSGMLVDNFQRKPLFLLCYFLFAAYFIGYLFAGTLFMLAIIRSMHGFVFGIASTSANTLAIDTLPSSKLGSGIGIYGTAASIAMAFGPMAGLLLLHNYSYHAVFMVAFIASVLAFLVGSTIKSEYREIPKSTKPFSLEKIFLVRGWPIVLSILLMASLYGVLVNYLSLFARERGIGTNPGYFFCFLALGLVMSRFIAGKLIDGGYICRTIVAGKLILLGSVLLFILVPDEAVFFGAAVFIGLGYGLVSPTYQTLIIRLAKREQRGTANSTYLTAWDAGIGFAIFGGGVLSEHIPLAAVLMLGTFFLLLSMLFFSIVGAPYFKRFVIIDKQPVSSLG